MGQRRSKLDRHAAELLALRRAGATVAQLTRWLRLERDTAAAATTVGRWLDKVVARKIHQCDDFDAVAVLDELRARTGRCASRAWPSLASTPSATTSCACAMLATKKKRLIHKQIRK